MPAFETYWTGLADGTLSDAGKVGITDTHGGYTSTNIDGALDEIAYKGGGIFIPANQFSVLFGSPTLNTGTYSFPAWLLQPSSTEVVACLIQLPGNGWSTVDVDVWWTATAGSGDVQIRVDVNGYEDGDTASSTADGGNTSATLTAPTVGVIKVSNIVSGRAVTSKTLLRVTVRTTGTGTLAANDIAFYGAWVKPTPV